MVYSKRELDSCLYLTFLKTLMNGETDFERMKSNEFTKQADDYRCR